MAKAKTTDEVTDETKPSEESASTDTEKKPDSPDAENITPAEGSADVAKETTEKTTTEKVVLKGWDEGREGVHTIHLKQGIFNFINGKAEFTAEKAAALREAGYIE